MAMKQIEAAAKTLGVNLKGDGHAHEAQGVSDDHLVYAQGLLENLAGAVGGPGLKHIQSAIEQLTIALSVR